MLHDKDIREPLFDFLDETYGKLRIIEEKTMGKSRADVVMVTEDSIIGIEIKSDADTYTRLAGQVKDYDKYFDMNYVVVGTSHAMHIDEHVPDYWGIITVEIENPVTNPVPGVNGVTVEAPRIDFYILRRPASNPNVTWKKKLEILWRPELAMLQEWNGMPKYADKSKIFVKNKIAERIENGKIREAALKKQVSDILFDRDYTAIGKMLEDYRLENRNNIRSKRKNNNK